MSFRSTDVFNASQNRLRAATCQDSEERANAEYAEKHNLQGLFAEFAAHLHQKDPKTEQDAERVLLDLLAHRKAERDRAALRLHFDRSFEVSLDNGRKNLKLQIGSESGSLSIMQKGRVVNMNETCTISLEQVEELTEVFYELGRFVVENPKGDGGGFIGIDDRDVFLLSGSRDCADVGDEIINKALHISLINKKE